MFNERPVATAVDAHFAEQHNMTRCERRILNAYFKLDKNQRNAVMDVINTLVDKINEASDAEPEVEAPWEQEARQLEEQARQIELQAKRIRSSMGKNAPS